MSRYLCAIDPGKTGALAFHNPDSDVPVWVTPMPETLTDLRDLMDEHSHYTVIVERQNGLMRGKGIGQIQKFIRGCGEIDGVLVGLQIPHDHVLPNTWMRGLIGSAKGKKAIKDKVQRLYPHLRVTNNTADALGILAWALERVTK